MNSSSSTGSSSDVLALFSLTFVSLATNSYMLHCRGNKLEDVGEISKNLASESKKYNWGAKQLSAMVSVGAY